MKHTSRIKKQTIPILLSILLLVSCFTIYASWTSAQTVVPLRVSPARQELTLQPGESYGIAVKFSNNGENPVTGVVRVADFEVTNKEGTSTIIDSPEQASPKFSAAQWVTLVNDKIAIPANDRVLVQAQINVPKNARPGGRYVAIFFEPGTNISANSTKQTAAGSGVTSRIATLFYIKIPGHTFEKALISRMFTPTLQEYGPIKLEFDVLNRGDYHIRPRGVLSLSNMIGGIESQEKLIEQNIFPDAARTYTQELGKKWMFGRYRIDLAASYGETGQAMSRFIYVWILPWKIISVIILTLAILMMFVRNYYKGIAVKQKSLEETLVKEEKEIQALKDQLRKKHE